jgi:ribosomal protein S18 acetylase RimI-like enzyme
MDEPENRIEIRKATTDDVDGILHCLASAFEPYRTSYTPDAYLDTVLTAETVPLRLSSMQVFVALKDGQIVGTIACAGSDGEEGHLRGMAVLPQWQSQGLAVRLLRAAESELVERGCARITLDTTEPLQRAMRFYERHGYCRSGRTIDFFGMPLHEYVKDV